MSHGWIRLDQNPVDNTAWIDSTSNSIVQYLAANSLDNWKVQGFKWIDGAHKPDPMIALSDAKQQGVKIGTNVVAMGTNAWKHIHFIAHSAGAGLIQKATEQIKASLPNTIIHCTFLDAYEGVVGEYAYEYGADANWSDSYFVRDMWQQLGVTGRPMPYASNVDVTALDPQETSNQVYVGPGYSSPCNTLESIHGWPITFYTNSIAGVLAGGNMSSITNGSYYDNFGLLLSEECGNWSFATNYYQPGNGLSYGSVTNLGPENGTCIPPYIIPPGYIGVAAAFSVASTIKSVTGTFETWLGSILWGTGSPVWIATVITDTNALNYVSFDAEFTSASGADGLLSVYWDTGMIGLVDETAVQPGFQHYNFSFPNTVPNTSHVLGFHLDPFTSVQSTMIVTNIVNGCAGVSQPFSLSITTNKSGGLLVYQLTGQPVNYTIMASSDLINWTSIAVLANTNGAVNFVDPNSANYGMRFYRAAAAAP